MGGKKQWCQGISKLSTVSGNASPVTLQQNNICTIFKNFQYKLYFVEKSNTTGQTP